MVALRHLFGYEDRLTGSSRVQALRRASLYGVIGAMNGHAPSQSNKGIGQVIEWLCRSCIGVGKSLIQN